MNSYTKTHRDLNTERLKQEINIELENILSEQITKARQIDPVYADLLEQITVLVRRGGKRLRPILTILSYEAYGGTDKQAILPVAASQELFHAFILMHDDIVDRDYLRWGGPNLSGHYRQQFSSHLKSGDAKHFANAWALLGGDICLSLSINSICQSTFPASMIVEAIKYLHQTLLSMVGGELLDMALPMHLPDVPATKKRLLNVCYYKTAIYSFCTPLQLGALLAGASASTRHKLESFGVQLGIAYQLQDDILGMFGSQEGQGKPIISDMHEGKQTILIYFARQLAPSKDVKLIDSLVGNQKATDADLQSLRVILDSCGAKTKTKKLANKYAAQARVLLKDLDLPSPFDSFLRDLTHFATTRAK